MDATNGLTVTYATPARTITIENFYAFTNEEVVILSCSGMKNPNTLPSSPFRTGTLKIETFYDKT